MKIFNKIKNLFCKVSRITVFSNINNFSLISSEQSGQIRLCEVKTEILQGLRIVTSSLSRFKLLNMLLHWSFFSLGVLRISAQKLFSL